MAGQELTLALYRRNLADGRLTGARCLECGELTLPPKPFCPRCHANRMEAVDFSGEGAVTGFTSVFVPGPDMAAKGYGRRNPYVAALVTLVEGPGVAARVAAPDPTAPDGGVRVGMPVKADFVAEGDDESVSLVFRPA